jgi:hypothetical protein
MMLKTLIVAAVALPLGVTAALAGGSGCNWSSKENTVAQTQTPAPAPVAAATQTPVPAEPVKLEVAEAPTKPAEPKTN